MSTLCVPVDLDFGGEEVCSEVTVSLVGDGLVPFHRTSPDRFAWLSCPGQWDEQRPTVRAQPRVLTRRELGGESICPTLFRHAKYRHQ